MRSLFQSEPVTVPSKQLIWQVRSAEASGERPLPSPDLVIKLKQRKPVARRLSGLGRLSSTEKWPVGMWTSRACVGLLESPSSLGHDLHQVLGTSEAPAAVRVSAPTRVPKAPRSVLL